jgi:hypothetical protein
MLDATDDVMHAPYHQNSHRPGLTILPHGTDNVFIILHVLSNFAEVIISLPIATIRALRSYYCPTRRHRHRERYSSPLMLHAKPRPAQRMPAIAFVVILASHFDVTRLFDEIKDYFYLYYMIFRIWR